MREFFICLGLCSLVFYSYSQQSEIKSIELGFKAGLSNYQGDLVKESLNVGETHLALGGYGRIFLNEKWGIGLGLNFATISANDRNYVDTPGPDRYDRGIKMKSSILEGTVRLEYFPFLDRSPLYNSWFRFQPYAGTGISIIWNKLEFEDQNINDGIIEPEIETPVLSFPMIAGIKYVIRHDISVAAETCFNVTLTDRLDGYAFNDNNDWYMFHSISLSWHFTNGSKYNQVREKKKYKVKKRRRR